MEIDADRCLNSAVTANPLSIERAPITDDDSSNKVLDIETQLVWLREIGFKDVDCFWKWLELALLGETKP